TATAQVRFSGQHGLQVGHRLNVQHKYLLGPASLGQMEVIALGKNAVTVRPIGAFNFAKLAVGDEATTGRATKTFFKRQPAVVDEPAVAEELPADPVAKTPAARGSTDSLKLVEPEVVSKRPVPLPKVETVAQEAAARPASPPAGQKSSRRQVA